MRSLSHIFVSGTTFDFTNVQQHVTNLVLKHGCHPVVEDGFEIPFNSSIHIPALSFAGGFDPAHEVFV